MDTPEEFPLVIQDNYAIHPKEKNMYTRTVSNYQICYDYSSKTFHQYIKPFADENLVDDKVDWFSKRKKKFF